LLARGAGFRAWSAKRRRGLQEEGRQGGTAGRGGGGVNGGATWVCGSGGGACLLVTDSDRVAGGVEQTLHDGRRVHMLAPAARPDTGRQRAALPARTQCSGAGAPDRHRRYETCPLSTRGGTRCVQLVRRGRGGRGERGAPDRHRHKEPLQLPHELYRRARSLRLCSLRAARRVPVGLGRHVVRGHGRVQDRVAKKRNRIVRLGRPQHHKVRL